MAKAPDDMTFEQAVKRLEAVVAQLEKPDVSLDQTLALFQEGKRLAALCQQRLTAVEQRISQLLETPDGTLTLEPLAGSGENEEG